MLTMYCLNFKFDINKITINHESLKWPVGLTVVVILGGLGPLLLYMVCIGEDDNPG